MKARLIAQLAGRPDALIAVCSVYDPTDGWRWGESKKDQKHGTSSSLPPNPPSSGRRPSSAVLSDGAQARHREEGSWRRRGEGRLWQPFCKAAWKQAEIQAAAVRLQCHQWLPVINLHSGHHTHPLFSPHHPLTLPLSLSAEQHCVCVCVHSPTRSRSLSLCEAPVIVGGLLLWKQQKMQHEFYVLMQQPAAEAVLTCHFESAWVMLLCLTHVSVTMCVWRFLFEIWTDCSVRLNKGL